MHSSIRIQAAVASIMTTIAVAPTASAGPPPLQLHPAGRFLETADGSPFFWLADTAWTLYRLDPAEVNQYMANRAAKGFNVIQGPLLVHAASDRTNYQGQVSNDPANPNAAWFDHIDTIVDAAEAHGLYLAPAVMHNSLIEGLTPSAAYGFGYYVGDRYRERTAIGAFIVGQEFNYPSGNVALWNEVARGLQDGLAGAPRLLTAHPRWYDGVNGQSSSAHLHDEPWLSFNMIQSSLFGDCTNDPGHERYAGTHNWLLVEHDYGLLPVRPTLDAEATYEQMPLTPPPWCDFNQSRWDAFGVRRRAYWSVFAGGLGHSYGANGVIQFNQEDDPVATWSPQDFWEAAMDYPGAAQMGHLRRLMESRPLVSRVPGQDLLVPYPGPAVPTHVHATRDADGRYAFVYIPQPDRTVTIDMSLIPASTVRAWWFTPADGQAVEIGTYERADLDPGPALSFTTPAAGEDWVLVVDDAGAGFLPPGVVPEPCPADVNGDGTVDVDDLVGAITGWGPCAGSCPADVDDDGVVGLDDLTAIILGWGPCP